MGDTRRMGSTDELLVQLQTENVPYFASRMPRIARQHYTCEACDRWGYAWDHCHAHGWIRGLLCGRCNLFFAEFDRGLIPYFTTDSDIDRWQSWRDRCDDCAAQLGLIG